MFVLQPKHDNRTKFENALLDYYPRLIEWALQLTRRDYSEAEDLVQDLYLRFARLDVAFDHIENLESYLFLVLRNLYYAHLRRARTSAIDDLAISGHETLDRHLRAVDHHELAFVRADLEQICDHLCERKNASRSASILLLRYYLGYFPSEVMRLAKTTRIAVDKAVQTARREARLELSGSRGPRKTSADGGMKPSALHASDDPQQIFFSLRARIFDSCAGECFSLAFLKQHYANADSGFTTEELAHLVSCSTCLDRANRLLGLPLLAERSPEETIGRDTPQGPDKGAGAGGTPLLISSRGKRPKEDAGRIRRRMERRIQEAMEHRPERLHITVDGDLRASQRVTAQLSELQVDLGRHERPTYVEVLGEHNICIAFLLVRTPSLYQKLSQVHEMRLSDDRTIKVVIAFASESPTIDVVYYDPLMGLEAEEDELEIGAAARTLPYRGGFLAALLALRGKVFDEVLQRARSWFPRISAPKMNPLFTTAVVLGLTSILCFVLWTRSKQGISAHDLLLRAQKQEASATQKESSGVIVQKVRIKTAERTAVRTLYRDIQHKRHAREKALDAIDAQLKTRLATAGVDWDDPLSPTAYRDWRNREFIQSDIVKKESNNLLTLTTNVNDGNIVSESLTVRTSDFHAVGKTVELRDYGTVEIAEVDYSVLPWSAAKTDWFEPGVSSVSDSRSHVALLSRIRQPLTDDDLDEADLSVRLALNQLGADTGERITEVRTPQGLLVKGAVATEERKNEIEARLIRIPHVTPIIFTFNELQSRSGEQNVTTSIAAVSDAAQSSPLEDYLVKQGQSRESARQFTEELIDTSIAIDQDSRAIAQLLKDFGNGKLATTAAQTTLRQLLEIHKTRLLAAVQRQTAMIAPLDGVAAPAGMLSESDRDLETLASHDFTLCKSLSRNDGSATMPIQTRLEELADSARQLDTAIRRISTSSPPGNRHESANTFQPDNQR